MPKVSSLPILLDEIPQLSITKLKSWGYLKPIQIKKGIIKWQMSNGLEHRIALTAFMLGQQQYIELDYKYENENISHRIELVTTVANIGKGKIWYFLCPKTKKMCRKVYFANGLFAHREAFNNSLYKSQTYSKSWRSIEKIYGAFFSLSKNKAQINAKHFKRYYNGKPTKRYLKLLDKINRGEKIDYNEVELMMIK